MSPEQLLVVTPDTGNYESNISYGACNCPYKDQRKNQKGQRTVISNAARPYQVRWKNVKIG